MKFGYGVASLLLIGLVFLTTFCAQACFEPAPISNCPVHQNNDCCKHEDSNAGKVTLTTLNHHRVTKVFVARPAQLATIPMADPFVFSLLRKTETGFQPASLNRPLSPSPILHAIRI